MNLSNYYWYFGGALTPRFCDEVIKYALSKEEVMARTGGYGNKPLKKEDVKNLQRKRRSDLVWLNDTWIYKEIHPFVHQANKNAGWNFEWDFSESCQFTKYKLDQFYDWHCDSWNKPYDKPDDPNTHGKIRKLSCTVSLSDETEYEGGDFEFDFRNHFKDALKNNLETVKKHNGLFEKDKLQWIKLSTLHRKKHMFRPWYKRFIPQITELLK